MNSWPTHPVVYEINTWVWLNELSRKYERPLTLATVPSEEWDALSSIGADAIWFMGVWERSPAGVAISNQNPGLLEDFRRALPDFRAEDNIGSPYCVRRYEVDEHLGGRQGLSAARGELSRRGLRLILDFVPNHVAPDHPWVVEHPEYFVQGGADDAGNDPASFISFGDRVFARGRDTFFPAWPDVLQLNAFQPGLRRAVIATLAEIAGQCDGLRCDMAMLMLNAVFERTWGPRAGQRPAAEYWSEVIAATNQTHPDFLFVAEAYWELEWELQQQGFDYCYDKRLYDRLKHDSAENVRLHLCAERTCQEKLVRFIENHDELRASSVFSPQKQRAAAVVIALIPGAKFFHEGQFEGRKVRLPVFLARRPVETPDADRQEFYRKLLRVASAEGLGNGNGHWHLCGCTGWPDNPSCRHLLAWCWRGAGEYHLIVVNYFDTGAQGRVRLPWDDLSGRSWKMTDLFTGQIYECHGDEMRHPGIYVDLRPWEYHVWGRWTPTGEAARAEAESCSHDPAVSCFRS